MSYTEMLGILSLVLLLISIFSGFPITFTFLFIGLVMGYLGFGKVVFHLMNIHLNPWTSAVKTVHSKF
jgi:TRAP-type mannitol/chloroaromatic compound transport system permease large subunit